MQTVLVIFCYAWSTLPGRLIVLLGAVLSALTFRDAYTYFNPGDEEEIPLASQYYLKSAGDAATVAVFAMAAEVLMLKFSPSLALPMEVLFRGGLVCLPLLPTLRMALRPRPDPKTPFEGSKMSAEEIYRTVWWLNILWMAAFYGTIAATVSDVRGSNLDRMRGFMPMMLFAVWYCFQRDGLARHDYLETFRTDWKKKLLRRKKETLPLGLTRGQPFYWGYVVTQGLIFLQLAAFLAATAWPWLSGQGAQVDYFRLGFSLVTFTVSVLSWNFVKSSNRAAARALQAEIDAAPDLL